MSQKLYLSGGKNDDFCQFWGVLDIRVLNGLGINLENFGGFGNFLQISGLITIVLNKTGRRRQSIQPFFVGWTELNEIASNPRDQGRGGIKPICRKFSP